jgi:hypothetical protein
MDGNHSMQPWDPVGLARGGYIGSPTGRIRKLVNWEVRGDLDSGNGPSWEAEHIT